MNAQQHWTFRPYRGEADLPAMVEVINACNCADKIDEVETLDTMTHDYTHLTNCDPATDMQMAEAGGRLVGYGRVWWWQTDQGERIYGLSGYVHPDWRRRGIGRALLAWQERRARDIAAGHPQDGPRWLQGWMVDTAVGRRALFDGAGYQPARYGFMMVRPLGEPIPDLPLPDGLEVRPVEAGHKRRIFDALNEAFRDHWGHREMTEEDFQSWNVWPMATPHLWQVAWADGEVAGMVLNTIIPEDNQQFGVLRGWTDPICVRRPWRKRGLARALIMRSLGVLKEQGMTEGALGVDTQNLSGALRLYESCGYRVHNSSTTVRKAM